MVGGLLIFNPVLFPCSRDPKNKFFLHRKWCYKYWGRGHVTVWGVVFSRTQYQWHGSALSHCTTEVVSVTFLCGYLDGSCSVKAITTDRLLVVPYHGAQSMG